MAIPMLSGEMCRVRVNHVHTNDHVLDEYVCRDEKGKLSKVSYSAVEPAVCHNSITHQEDLAA